MTELKEIQELRTIYETDRSRLYIGKRQGNVDVLVKEDTTGDLSRLHNETEISSVLPDQKAHAQMQLYNGRLVLVRDYLDGKTLKEIIPPKGLGLKDFFPLAIGLVGELKALHERYVLHNDVNPKNVIVDKSRKCRLIDFEFSSSLQDIEVAYQQSQPVTGTLEYMSPEQTGRMNRKLDYRSDYYSLGASLYEMLTGSPPFESEDILEMIHNHLAMAPLPPSTIRAEVPAVLDKIVLKLLSKNAEDRYQSLVGLLLDLEACSIAWEKDGQIPEFEPGASDVASQLSISQKLYGRQHEIELLKSCFESACEGHRVLLSIGGYSGTGKSVFCRELLKYIGTKKGIFLSGSYEVLDNQTPYLAWVRAFNQFADWLLAQPETIQQEWSHKFQKELKGLGNIIIELVPKLAYIFPKQPSLVQLSGFENQQRVQYTINAFIKSLASSDTPLVLFLDDFQWADEASFDLLKNVFSNFALGNLLVLATFRDNETPDFHPFSQTVQYLKTNQHASGSKVVEIHLEPLSEEDVSALLCDSLRMTPLDVAPLARLLMEKTKGNAFEINKILETLYQQKLLVFDFTKQRWLWNMDEIAEFRLSDNIIDLLLLNIRKLDEKVLRLIKVAAVIGLEFSLDQVSLISGEETATIHKEFWPLIQERSLLPMQADYHYLPEYYQLIHKEVRLKFAHPRIQQAVYQLLNESEKSRFHFEIGLILLEKFRGKEDDFPWIDIARHFSIGFDQVNASKEREEIGQIMREAGKITAQAASFEVALTFTEKSLECLHSALSRGEKFRMYLNMLEYAFLTKHEDKLQYFKQEAMDLAQDKADKLAVYELLIKGLDFGNHQNEAIATTRKALSEVGIAIPEKANKLQVIWQAIQINSMLPSSKFEKIPQLPLAEDEETKAIFKVLVAALPPYFFSNIETYPLLIFHILKLTLKKGLTPESVPGLASYGLILSGAMKKPRQGYDVVKETFKLLETVPGADKYSATIYMIYLAFICHIKENIREKLPMAQEGFRKGLAAGNMEYASWNMLFDVLIKYQLGVDYEQLLKEGNEISHFQRQYNFYNQEAHLAVCLRAVEVMVAGPSTWEEALRSFNLMEEEYFVNAIAEKNAVYLVGYYGIKGCLNLWFGRFHDAFAFLKLMKAQLPNQVPSYLNNNNQFQYTLSCALIAAKTGERKVLGVDLIKEIQAGIKMLKNGAVLNPGSETPLFLFVEAMLEWIMDRHINHEKFERSIQLLDELGYPMMYVNFCEWYGDLLAGKDNAKHDYYRNCAILRSKQMKTEAKTQLLMESRLLDPTAKSTEQSTVKSSGSLQVASLDTKTLVKTMQALISEIKVESLLQKLLTYAMENTGAQEGHFIINRNDTWVHEVSIKANHTLHTEFPRIDLERTSEVSKSIIQYSSRTQEPLVIANAAATMPFDVDPIVLRKKIKSVLCIPFINQSKISGIIYLSHSQMTEAFKVEHISLMRLMAGQIGTIIENALLYEQMENLVKERTRQLEHEKLKSDNLLLNILPKEVANELKETGKASARLYERVSVMFIDIKSFTTIAQDMTPDELVKNLDRLFSGFDSIVTDLNLEKIKTIGDAYMVAGGIPVPTEDHLTKMLDAAFLIQDFIKEQNISKEQQGEPPFEVRIGIHIGPVVAGVVGDRKFAYDIWGDTVNIASRMEQNSEPGKINVSESVFEQISEKYDCEYRGQIPVKNKGNMKMYFVKKI